MKSKEPVLLVTNDPETATAVASALDSIDRSTSDGLCQNLDELVARLERAPTKGVIVDIDPAPSQVLSDLDPIVSKFPEVRFVVLSSVQSDELVLEAMQIGARHFMLKQSIAPELGRALERLVPKGAATDQDRGAVITVLGASGGCGATTLAINLAYELHLAISEPVLLVDLDCCYGAVGAYLGLDGQYGIHDILADTERVDAQLVSSTALPYSDGLHALLSPASINNSEVDSLQYEHLSPAIDACKHAYKYTVIDAARVPIAVAANLALTSKLTLIALQLSVKDIKAARRLLSGLADRRVSADRIMPIANRYHKRHSMISLKEAETALGGVSLGRVRNDYGNAMRGINYGQALAQAAPRSAVRRDIQELAAKVVKRCANP